MIYIMRLNSLTKIDVLLWFAQLALIVFITKTLSFVEKTLCYFISLSKFTKTMKPHTNLCNTFFHFEIILYKVLFPYIIYTLWSKESYTSMFDRNKINDHLFLLFTEYEY